MSDERNPKAPGSSQRARHDAETHEESHDALPPDPELEAALRAAADAIPDDADDADPDDDAKPEPEVRGEPLEGPVAGREDLPDSEVLLDEALEEGPPERQIQRLRQQVTESNDRLIRLQADFENFRKRAYRDRQDALNYGHQNLVKDLLSVVDNLDRAIAHAGQSGGGDLQNFLQGVELVRRELLGVFEKHHVVEVDALGKHFDPALHEAMAQVADETAPANTVVEVLEKGYQLRDRLVRPARVIVAKPPDAPADGGGGEPTAE